MKALNLRVESSNVTIGQICSNLLLVVLDLEEELGAKQDKGC
jgi:hypothetical protein